MTQIMGILNVTPDSFADQGRWFDHAAAIQKGITLAQEGADWIDIGGESTRPQATPVDAAEELRRVIPVICALKQHTKIPLSIDTMKGEVAQAALEAGVSFINDVSGFRDPLMRQVAIQANVPICLMHMHQTPQTMQTEIPHYPQGIVSFLCEWFQRQVELLLAEGIREKNIILDPGIGFGKTVAHNVEIIQNLRKIKALGFPVLIGLSRKSFLGKMTGLPVTDLLPATLTMNTLATCAQVDIIRVHDVAEHRQMVNCLRQCDSFKELGR